MVLIDSWQYDHVESWRDAVASHAGWAIKTEYLHRSEGSLIAIFPAIEDRKIPKHSVLIGVQSYMGSEQGKSLTFEDSCESQPTCFLHWGGLSRFITNDCGVHPTLKALFEMVQQANFPSQLGKFMFANFSSFHRF